MTLQDIKNCGPDKYHDSGEFKALVKDALHEWLDEKMSQFGKWSAKTVLAAGLVALAYFIFWANGWHK